MNDRLSEAKDFSPIDSRANLFYFLRTMSGFDEISCRKSGVDSALSDRQIEMRQNQDRLVL